MINKIRSILTKSILNYLHHYQKNISYSFKYSEIFFNHVQCIEIMYRMPSRWNSYSMDHRMLISFPCDLNFERYICETSRIQKNNAIVSYKKNSFVTDMNHLVEEIHSFYNQYILIQLKDWYYLIESIHHYHKKHNLAILSFFQLSSNDLSYIKQLQLPLLK